MKKVMIALLALAVLFSFAACDNSSSDSAAGRVSNVYSKNIPAYLTGEKIDLNDFEFVGEDLNGNEVEILVSDIVVVDPDALKAGATAGRAAIDPTALAYKGQPLGAIYYDAFEADAQSLKVAGPAENEEYYIDSAKKNIPFNYSKYTVSVTYTVDGEKVTKTLDAEAGDYTVDFDTVAVAANKGTSQAITFTTAVGGTQTDSTVKIDVIDDPIKGITVELKDEDEVIYEHQTATDKTGADKVNVFKVLESGYVDRGDADANAITDEATITASEGFTTGESTFAYGKAGEYTITAKYEEVSSSYENSVKISVTEDFIKSISAKVKDSSDTATNGIAVGADIPKTDIEVTVTYASGYTDENANKLGVDDFTINPTKMPAEAASVDNYPVTVALAGNTDVDTVDIAVKVKKA